MFSSSSFNIFCRGDGGGFNRFRRFRQGTNKRGGTDAYPDTFADREPEPKSEPVTDRCTVAGNDTFARPGTGPDAEPDTGADNAKILDDFLTVGIQKSALEKRAFCFLRCSYIVLRG